MPQKVRGLVVVTPLPVPSRDVLCLTSTDIPSNVDRYSLLAILGIITVGFALVRARARGRAPLLVLRGGRGDDHI